MKGAETLGSGNTLIWTLVVYNLVLLGIGLFTRRRTHDGTDFFLGGRKLGPMVAAVSASASSSSAWTLLSVSGAAYAWGLGALWLFPACVGGFLLNWFLLAPALHRRSHRDGTVTVTDVLAGPPGRKGRRVVVWSCSLIILVSLLAYVASQFQAAGKAFTAHFDVDPGVAILIGCGIVVAYTLLGGFWAVSITDTLQGLLMAATALLLPLAAFLEVGGWSGLSSGLAEVTVPGYLSLGRNLAPPAALGFVLGLLGIGLGYPGQPHVVNRFMALNERPGSLRRARGVAIAWAVVVYGGMLLLGFCSRVLLPGVGDAEQVFFRATTHLFPPVMAGVMVAAVLSAIMSTADSQLLVAASAVTNDLGFGGRATGGMLRTSRQVVVTLSLLALFPAIFGGQKIFDNVLFAWSAMGAAFGPLLIVTVIRGPLRTGRALAAVVTGFVLSVGAYEARRLFEGGEALAVLERVGAFLAALIVALWPGGAEASVAASGETKASRPGGRSES